MEFHHDLTIKNIVIAARKMALNRIFFGFFGLDRFDLPSTDSRTFMVGLETHGNRKICRYNIKQVYG
jgi:hypothetical protein